MDNPEIIWQPSDESKKSSNLSQFIELHSVFWCPLPPVISGKIGWMCSSYFPLYSFFICSGAFQKNS